MNYQYPQYPPNNQVFWRKIFVIVIVTLICLGIVYIYKNHNSSSTTAPTTSQVSGDKPSLGKSFAPEKVETQPVKPSGYPLKYKYTDLTETIGHKADGITVSCIEEYDQDTGKRIKETSYRPDGKTVDYIWEYDQETGNKIKETIYNDDGKTVSYIYEYDPKTGNFIKSTWYKDDGKTVSSIWEYDKHTGKRIY